MAILYAAILKSINSWAGASKLLSSENSNISNRPRTEEIIFEQDPHPKLQRTSGPFSEACLVRNKVSLP
jgi:hypothetical protein